MSLVITIIMVLLLLYIAIQLLPVAILIVSIGLFIYGINNLLVFLNGVPADVWIWSLISIGFICALPYVKGE